MMLLWEGGGPGLSDEINSLLLKGKGLTLAPPAPQMSLDVSKNRRGEAPALGQGQGWHLPRVPTVCPLRGGHSDHLGEENREQKPK